MNLPAFRRPILPVGLKGYQHLSSCLRGSLIRATMPIYRQCEIDCPRYQRSRQRSIRMRPFDSTGAFNIVTEAIPLHLALRNRTAQLDFSLTYPDDFPITPPRPALNGDLFPNLKNVWSENRNLMHAHSSSRSPPLTVAGSSRRHCRKPDTSAISLLPRCIHVGSHRHYIDILREQLCFPPGYVPSPSSPPELPQRSISSSDPYFSSITEPGPRSGRNIFLLAPHTGHFHSSGKDSKRVPLGILPFLSPRSGS